VEGRAAKGVRGGGGEAPVFIVGHPRSGTSLLAALLDRHPAFAVPPETHFFFLRLGRASDHEALWQLLPGSLRSLSGASQALATFRAGPPTPAALFRALMDAYAQSQGAVRWGEKSPWHLRRLPQILRDFRDARVVICIRDGRDCADACARAPFHSRGLLWYAASWRWAADLAGEARRRYPENVRVFRYEDLLCEPGAFVQTLDDFVGLPLHPRQLDVSVGTRSFSVVEEPWKAQVNQPLDRSRVGEWRERLGPWTLAVCQQLQGDELARFAYPPAEGAAPPSASVRLAAASYRALHAFVRWGKIFFGRL